MKHLLLKTIAAVLLVGCGPSMSIYDAATEGNIEVVKQHLTAGTDVNVKDRFGETPLHVAALGGHKEVVQLLITNGADVNVSTLRFTPLHLAIGRGHKEIVELLIAKGADVNTQDDDDKTPLDWAIKHKRTEIADLLRKHGGKTGEELKAEGK